MSSAFEVFRILIVYGEVVQQLPMLCLVVLILSVLTVFLFYVGLIY